MHNNVRLIFTIQGNHNTDLDYTANPLCKVVYYMNHTTGLCGSYSTQLYTTLHSFTQRFVHVGQYIHFFGNKLIG